MKLRIGAVEDGLHPSERVVSIRTRSGEEEIILDPNSVKGGSIEVGWPVGRDGRYFLVELPRQTARGISRVWVEEDSLEGIKEPA